MLSLHPGLDALPSLFLPYPFNIHPPDLANHDPIPYIGESPPEPLTVAIASGLDHAKHSATVQPLP